MKPLYFYIFLLLVGQGMVTRAQPPNWQWAKSAGLSGTQNCESIASDHNGNIYLIGNFESPRIAFGNDTLTSTDTADIFIAKCDSTGDVIWAKREGGTGNNVGGGIAVDGYGNVYIIGSFTSPTIVIGLDTLINNAPPPYGLNLFVAKYDPMGNVLWAKHAGGKNYDAGSRISADGEGNAYVTGWFSSPTIAFGFDTLFHDSVAGGDNIFVVKYDSTGNVIWAKSGGRTDDVWGNSIFCDDKGNAYVTGAFASPTLTLGGNTLINTALEPYYTSTNTFVVKYDTHGNVIWIKSAKGNRNDGLGISADAFGNVYVTGNFQPPNVILGSDSLINDSSINGGHFFIVKYDSTGNEVWARNASGPGRDGGDGISTDSFGNSFVIGTFSSPLISFGNYTLTNNANDSGANILIIKYDSGGNVIWAKSAGGTGFDYGTAITTNPNSDTYIAGYFESPFCIFGGISLTNNPDVHGDNIFIAKLGDFATSISDNVTIQNGLKVYPNPTSGNIYFEGDINQSVIEVYDLLGEQIYTGKADTDLVGLNLRGKAKGLYFYKIVSSNVTIQQGKIVIQ